MVDTSEWKREMERLAKKLAAHGEKKRLTHKARALLERDLMIAFYLLHKLMEDHRVSPDLADVEIETDSFPSPGRLEILTRPEALESLVNREAGEAATFKLGVLTNKIIHAYLIAAFPERNKPLRVIICSEFEHNTRLIVADLDHLLARLHEGALP